MLYLRIKTRLRLIGMIRVLVAAAKNIKTVVVKINNPPPRSGGVFYLYRFEISCQNSLQNSVTDFTLGDWLTVSNSFSTSPIGKASATLAKYSAALIPEPLKNRRLSVRTTCRA